MIDILTHAGHRLIITTTNSDRRISEETAAQFGLRYGDFVPVGPKLLAVVRAEHRAAQPISPSVAAK